MSLFPADIEELARRIITDFTARGFMVSTAESCTGGLIAGALTEIAGSSAVVDRGFVTYTNEAKMDMLGLASGHWRISARYPGRRRCRWRMARCSVHGRILPWP